MTTAASGGGVDSIAKVIEDMRGESQGGAFFVAGVDVDKWADRLSAISRGELVAYLCDNHRFKLSFDSRGRINSLCHFKNDLEGRWVALVAAEDDAHLRLAHPNAARGVDEWLPIESAPRVAGEKIWAYLPDDEQVALQWCETDDWSGWVFVDSLLRDAQDFDLNPTHWRPLPDPPALNPQESTNG